MLNDEAQAPAPRGVSVLETLAQRSKTLAQHGKTRTHFTISVESTIWAWRKLQRNTDKLRRTTEKLRRTEEAQGPAIQEKLGLVRKEYDKENYVNAANRWRVWNDYDWLFTSKDAKEPVPRSPWPFSPAPFSDDYKLAKKISKENSFQYK